MEPEPVQGSFRIAGLNQHPKDGGLAAVEFLYFLGNAQTDQFPYTDLFPRNMDSKRVLCFTQASSRFIAD